MAEQRKLYHYTTLDALSYIIKEDSLHFNLSEYCSLNDKDELNYFDREVFNLLRQNKYLNSSSFINIQQQRTGQQHMEQTDSFYVLSFSEAKDSLPMWSMYGDNCRGAVIEIDSPIQESSNNSLKELIKKFESFEESAPPSFIKEDYNTDDSLVEMVVKLLTMAQIENISTDYIYEAYNRFVKKFSIYVKSPFFEYEKEWRLAIRLHNNREKDKIKSRICKNGNIIHYYEHTMEKEKLKRIILGPLCNNEAKGNLEKLLKSRGYKDVEIEVSKIPYQK